MDASKEGIYFYTCLNDRTIPPFTNPILVLFGINIDGKVVSLLDILTICVDVSNQL
jgi:hypothetical protein